VNEDDRMLWEAAVFGKEVEDWLKSDIGDYMVQRARTEAIECYGQLKVVSPWRWLKIQDLQNRIKVCEWFRDWLGEAYQTGVQATQALEEEHGP
jgi:hypothetical protein